MKITEKRTLVAALLVGGLLLGSACTPAGKPAVASAAYCSTPDYWGKHDVVKVNLSRPTPGTWVEVYDADNYNEFLAIDSFDSSPDVYLHLEHFDTTYISNRVKVVVTWPDFSSTVVKYVNLVPACYVP